MSDIEQYGGISRRTLVKSSAIGSLALAAGGLSLPFGMRTAAAAVQQAIQPAEEKVVWGACSVNCGSRCALQLHVKDDEVVWVESDTTGDDIYGQHQVRACLRGRSIRRRINHPDRLNYPMKRVGKRGEGKFERITWQEALDTISDSLKNTVEKYGNEAVYINYTSGIVGGNITRSSPYASLVARLMNCYGGFLSHYGTYSTAQIAAAMPYTYGSNDGNSTSDIENTKLVVMFGNNPAETRMSGGGITYFLEQARERSNARMIVIDPRYTDTAAGREDEWIPIRPGTDAALVAGLAWVMINENLVDQAFLDTYCIGYDEKTLPADAPANGHYKAYILGNGDDGIAKTPQWASHVTGIPADRIIKLAREIGSTKPAYICQGWGPQRQANGELTSRAIAMLPILTGNVGINGGNSGARESTYTITIERMPLPENPIKTQISCFSWTDAIARGPEMTATRDGVRGKDKLDVPIKFIWNYAGNTITNQHSDINKTHEILQDDTKCEMIVVIENFMTSSAKYADILLPDLMTVEQEDIIPNDYAGNMGYLIFIQPATSPKFERKPIYWIMSEVAKRLGNDIYQRFTEGRTQEQWLQYLYAKMLAKDPALPSYDELKKMGIYKRKDPNGHFVAYKKFRDDPQANPLKTPSGKIEIYSSRCTGCKTCELACKDYKDLTPDVSFRRIYEYAGGDWQEDNGVWRQNVFAYYLSIACNHCEDPACTKVCPSGAMHKRDDGFVVVDEDVCIGCRYCHMACPYGAPQYNAAKGHMTKCDGCHDRVADGKKPVCVESCPLRALDFGPIDELRKKHGDLAAVAPLPSAHFTRPSIVIKPNANCRPTGDTTGFLANPKEV